MAQRVATETLFYNADRSKLVAEDSADAAYLFVRAGSPVDEAEAERLGYKGNLNEAAEYPAKLDHALKHGGESQLQAAAKRQAMYEGVPDPDGPPVAGERGTLEEEAKAAEAANVDTKAVSRAPANKGK